MTATESIDPAPDWEALTTEFHCPLCEYNLRGLDQPRCPECGFVFTWAELKRGQEQTHPYLFEHQPKRNVWSFWKTYWNDCLPQIFWLELSPAQPVRVPRLMIYWFIASALMIFAVTIQLGYGVFYEYHKAPSGFRFIYPASPFSPMAVSVPPAPPAMFTPTPVSFWDQVSDAWLAAFADCLRHSMFVGAVVVLLWPWLTLLFLMIFAESMRKAKINKRHVLRVIVYGCDFGFVMLLPILLGVQAYFSSGFAVIIAMLCGAFTLYRVGFAYARYLRFHMPFATVLSSQIMVMLIFLIVYIRVVQH